MHHGDDQHQRALDQLMPYADVIVGGADRQRVRFVPDTWRDWLADAGWGQDDIESALGAFDDDTVTRHHLRRLAAGALDERTRAQLFAATLIWGRGKANGRMRQHMVGVLSGSAHRNDVLAATAKAAGDGRPEDAYASWRLRGLREPFFTKWLWAASYTGAPNRRCLVLDGRVWSSLNDALDWSSVTATGTTRRAARYAAYIDACHSWAHELPGGVTAEDVEWALFDAAGRLERLNRHRQ